jgi:hypothetical protein
MYDPDERTEFVIPNCKIHPRILSKKRDQHPQRIIGNKRHTYVLKSQQRIESPNLKTNEMECQNSAHDSGDRNSKDSSEASHTSDWEKGGISREETN